MKMAIYLLKPYAQSLSLWRSFCYRIVAIKAGLSVVRKSSLTETIRSKPLEKRTPSYFLRLGFLALMIAGILSIPPNEKEDTTFAQLMDRGWHPVENVPCSIPLDINSFYEINNDEAYAEIYIGSNGQPLALNESIPAPPSQCHKINTPSEIKEL